MKSLIVVYMGKKKIITIDNYILFGATLLSTFISYILLGMDNISFAAVAVIFFYLIFSSKEHNGEYAYMLVWMLIILLSCFIGSKLKISFGFYVFLLIISHYYYLSFTQDQYSGKVIPFVVISATIGLNINDLSSDTYISYIIGTFVSLIVFTFTHRNRITFAAFQTATKLKSPYDNKFFTLLSSFIYSIFLFVTIFLPEYFKIDGVYWAAVTFVILLKPDTFHIVKDAIFRFWGCVIGALFTIMVMDIGSFSRSAMIVIILIGLFISPTLLTLNKMMKSFTITIFVLLVIEYASLGSRIDYALPFSRIYETLIGGGMAILASVVLHYLKNIAYNKIY